MPNADYRVVVEPIPAEDGGGFLAVVPDLPGCMSDGETQAEALKNVQKAIIDWIGHAQSEGQTVPPPSRHFHYGV